MRSSDPQKLPQEWAQHLAETAVVHPVNVVPSVGEPLLDVSKMDATTERMLDYGPRLGRAN